MMEKKVKSTTWNSDTIDALGLYRFLTRSLGLWPPDCHKIIPLIRVFVIIILEFLAIISLSGLLKGRDCDAVIDLIFAISLISCGILSIVKITFLRWNQNEMLEVIQNCINDWITISSYEIRNIMMKTAKLGKAVFIFQMAFASLTSIFIIVGPAIAPAIISTINSTFVDEDLRQLPLPNVCFHGTMSYIAFYILQSAQLMLMCTTNVGCDCYFFGIAMHIVGQFECLSVNFKNLGKWKNLETYRKNFAQCVQRHLLLLKLSKNLENTFNIILLFQISANVVQICINGLRMIISIRTKDFAATLNLIMVIKVLTVQVFLYCYSGIRLTSAARNLHTSSYFSNWYKLPPNLVRDSMFVIMRASKPFSLTAGHVVDMNLESFTSFVKAIGSYFSVLQAMIEV